MNRGMVSVAAFLLSGCLAAPVWADWKLMSRDVAAAVVNGKMTVSPSQDWNRWSARPSEKGELWTRDGFALNELSFFAAIKHGEPIYRELDKTNQPLPKFKSEMLPTDLVELFEISNRIVLQTPLFAIDHVEPAKLGGHDGVRFSYHYALESDQLNRKGEGVAANIDGKLYLVNFVAPEIHYFDRDIGDFRALVGRIKI